MESNSPRIGVIGLGKMGLGISRRLAARGYGVVGFDRDPAVREKTASMASVAESVKEVVAALEPPRTVWMMVPAGDATEEVVVELSALLTEGDTLVDGGNSYYRDSIRRGEILADHGVAFLDVGTSGGLAGEHRGYCLMVGGEAAAVDRSAKIFEALAADGLEGWSHVGPGGAGHFVKMIHNGIEYGMMQALAEGFALLEARSDLDLDLAGVAELWRHGSIVSSTLLDHVSSALSADASLAGTPPHVADSGEGRWTVAEAIDLNVPAPVITLALLQRFRSRIDDSFADRLLAAMRLGFGGHQPRLL